MGKVQRLSHKQIEAAIKRDELRDFLTESGDWVKKHLENVLIGVVVVALLAFGAFYLLKNRREDSVKASIQLSSADQAFARAEGSGDTAAMDAAQAGYQQVKAAFDGRDEALDAELGLANVAFAQGKIDEAAAAYASFISSHGDSPLAPLAASGKAACLEASGKTPDAAAAYLALAQQQPESAVTAQSYFDAARCFQALGNRDALKQVAASLDKLDAEKRLPDGLKDKLVALKKGL
jgi:predicted negative regulator of RcsB-dependent stress response